MKENEANGPPNREMYALLHLSPDASDEEVHRMKETTTENFQRIFEAYKILSDENKRQIYDIYGMEGLNSRLELGPKLNKLEEIKEQLEKLRRMEEQKEIKEQLEKLRRMEEQKEMSAHFLLPTGTIIITLNYHNDHSKDST
ncbi:hypothetical protein Goshw_002386 [Gossypium schwendimanii]|uniref:J domain-containing protein n=1 Tax=Gossypium schwendimanii TaxID=34291 RepID=A0A7J9L0F6_GOSSC|nr:hypothetical protein [Gossypium schwendimanii]